MGLVSLRDGSFCPNSNVDFLLFFSLWSFPLHFFLDQPRARSFLSSFTFIFCPLSYLYYRFYWNFPLYSFFVVANIWQYLIYPHCTGFCLLLASISSASVYSIGHSAPNWITFTLSRFESLHLVQFSQKWHRLMVLHQVLLVLVFRCQRVQSEGLSVLKVQADAHLDFLFIGNAHNFNS